MDMSNSQYNSASESGWTNYFEQSYLSENNNFHGIVDYQRKGTRMEEDEEEEEDLSMVSDASSGPPHYHVEDDQPYSVNWHPSNSLLQYTKESKKKAREYGRNQHPSPLDDTASSPALNYPKKKTSFSGNGAVENTLDFTPSSSATRIRRKPKFQKHSEHSFGGKQASGESGGFNEERK